MKNLTDITNLTDAVLDALLAIKSGEDYVDCSQLTERERFELCAALGMSDARARAWCAGIAAPRAAAATTGDHEAAILSRQDREVA